MKSFWQRLFALTKKEWRQLLRDPSSMAVGLVLPIILIFIFGTGLSLDLGLTNIAVVNQSPGKVTTAIVQGFKGSKYLNPIEVKSMHEAERLLLEQKVKGIVNFPDDFSSTFAQGKGHIQVIVHGVEIVSAKSLQRYILQSAQISLEQLGLGKNAGGIAVPRMWFNAANSSTWYFIPGLIVVVMTIVGAFLTALVIAREWERGTLEMLFSTPARPSEILLSKVIPYFIVGMGGLFLCLLFSYFFFEVPMVGSLAIIIGSSVLYLLTALGLGLLISALLKNQFLASQACILISFLPCVLLSGFVFDLRNVPDAIAVISYALPATYFMELIRGSFLSGDDPAMVVKDWLILLGYAVLFFIIVKVNLKKTLEK